MASMPETVRMMSDGQRGDILATMAGVIPSLSFDDAQRIIGNKGPLVTGVREAFRRYEIAPTPTASPFVHDKTKDGWTLVSDLGFNPALTSASALDLVAFLKDGESSIGGEELVSRAPGLNAHLGQMHAEWLLERQGEIPKEFRNHYLVFPATIWRGPFSSRYVPYLRWDGKRWILDFGWLGDGFRGRGRVVRPRE